MSVLAGMAVFIGFSQTKQLTGHWPIKMRTLTPGNGLSIKQNGGIYGGILWDMSIKQIWWHFIGHANHIQWQCFWWEINYSMVLIWGITEK